jgi:hypothetical protein
VDAHPELTVVALVVLCLVGMSFALERPEASRARTLAWMIAFVAVSLVGIAGAAHLLR